MNKIIKGKKLENIAEKKLSCLVLLSTYNGETFIKEQLNSIFAQKHIEINVLIRDDGSKDNTVQFVEESSNNYEGKVKIVKGKNVGIHKSFKELMEISKELGQFDYYAFSDQDDVWDEDKISVAISSLIAYDSDFYSSSSRLVDCNMRDLGRTTSNIKKYKHYMFGNSKLLTSGAQGCTIVLNKKLYKYILEHDFPDCYGHDTWIPIVAYYMFNSLYDVLPHMNYRQHNSSWTGNRGNKIKQFFIESKFYFQGLSRYKKISKDFLERFRLDLEDKDIIVINAISGDNTSFIDRLRYLSLYHFGKYGVKENIVYRMYYLFINK